MIKETYLENSRKYIEETKIHCHVKPLSTQQIEDLENMYSIKFPESYKEFLLWMGYSAGSFFFGSDIFFSQIPHLKMWAIELLDENKFDPPLPANAFVFMMHQGYQFYFFEVSENPDPPIYYYNESIHKLSYELKYRNLDEFLLEELKIQGF